jgi:tyrosyl-tRNA synthetase
MTSLLDALNARGFVQDATPDLAARLARGPITGYVGFDPTADSLHVGNLVPVMGLAWLQRFGGTRHRGGRHGMVGDPAEARRRPCSRWADRPRGRIRPSCVVLGSAANAARMRNNADWLRPLS